MSGYGFAVALCVLLIVLVVALLRTRRIREKYAAIWIVVSVCVVVMAIFPGLAGWLATLVGVQTPVNLLFAIAFLVLLTVCIQLSTELSSMEESSRTVAEELALLRLRVDRALASATPPAVDAARRDGSNRAGDHEVTAEASAPPSARRS